MLTAGVAAQDADTSKAWKPGGFASLVINQVGLMNWAAGGENAFSSTAQVNLFLNYHKNKTIWDNSLDMGYGLMQTTGNPLRKNEDKLELNSKFGHSAFGKFFYSGLLNFKSQFRPGYNYPDDSVVSRFMAPAYLTIALGMDFKPSDVFTLFISPATGKFTFVNNRALADAGAYGVDAAEYEAGVKLKDGKTFRPEFGAYLRAKFQKDVVENVNLSSTLSLFDNYTDKIKENRANVDVNWEVLINIKAGKFLTTSVFTNLVYDHDVQIPTYEKVNGFKTLVGYGPKTQFKETIGVGLSYKF
jgi:hypothetical protein